LVAELQLAIYKQAPALASAERPFVYQLTVENQSLSPAPNVVIRDRLPLGVSYVDASNGAQVMPDADGTLIEWLLPAPLAAGATVTRTLTVTAATAVINRNYSVQSGGYLVNGQQPVLTIISQQLESATIDGAQGGTLTTADQTLSIALPANAVTTSVVMTVAKASGPLNEAGFGGLAFDLTATDPSGNAIRHFQTPITLQVRYNDSDWQNAGIRTEAELNLYFWDERQWVALLPCAGCSHDQLTNTITVVLDHLTLFALREDPRSRLYLPLVQQ